MSLLLLYRPSSGGVVVPDIPGKLGINPPPGWNRRRVDGNYGNYYGPVIVRPRNPRVRTDHIKP